MTWSWRKGLWRLTFAVWALGFAFWAVIGLADSDYLLSPSEMVHPEGASEPTWGSFPDEQLDEWAGFTLPELPNCSIKHPAARMVGTTWYEQCEKELAEPKAELRSAQIKYFIQLSLDPEASRALADLQVQWAAENQPRVLTPEYRKEAGELALILLAWSAVVWGAFYTGVWIVSGFGARGD